jgi:hypothetical protein
MEIRPRRSIRARCAHRFARIREEIAFIDERELLEKRRTHCFRVLFFSDDLTTSSGLREKRKEGKGKSPKKTKKIKRENTTQQQQTRTKKER